MLDAGFEDLAPVPSTKEAMKVIYCEGSAKSVKDSNIYSKIFEKEKDNYLFISTGGFMEAVNAYYAGRAGVKFVFGEKSTALALVDKSCSSNDVPIGPGKVIPRTSAEKPTFTNAERKEFLSSDAQQGYRMLRRKEIENYLFDPTVVALLPEDKRGVWDATRLQAAGKTVSDIDHVNGEVKDYLGDRADKMAMAELILAHKDNETRAIYRELLACLTKSN